MSTISSSINSALSAVYTYQAAIDASGSNIANANTEGYTRVTVDMKAMQPNETSYGLVGAGVEAVSVLRVYDSFCFAQINSSNEEVGRYEAEKKYMESVESIFNESEGAGLNEAVSGFFNSWKDLAENPSGDLERSLLASKAETLAGKLNDMNSDLTDIQKEIDGNISESIEEVNSLTNRIAGLNEEIAKAEAQGKNVNTLKDERDSLVNELSSLVDVNVNTNNKGQYCIQLSNGKPLVDGDGSWDLGVQTDPATGFQEITWLDKSGAPEIVTSAVNSGEIGGCLEVRDELIPEYIDQLDQISSAIISEVNSLLTSGYDINGDPGVPLFTGTNSGDIAVNQDILDDPGKIAASSTPEGAPGDGTVATAVRSLENEMLMNGGTSTLSGCYNSLVADIGAQTQSIDSSYQYQTEINEFYKNYRESVSGVSVDEESAKLVVYQNAYQAALQLISTLNNLLEAVVNM